MIELVFVIVVMGIIAAVALPRFAADNVQDAMDQILSDIRYTQHLALVDNVIDPTDTRWQSAFWTIQFQNTTDGGGDWAYTIGSDSDYGGNFSLAEAAVDPRDGRPIYGNVAAGATNVSPKVFISKKFGITNVDFATSCNVPTGAGAANNNASHIAFDNLGRPHKGHLNAAGLGPAAVSPNYASVMQGNCTIAFTFAGGEISWITIQRETGYACISNNAGICRQD